MSYLIHRMKKTVLKIARLKRASSYNGRPGTEESPHDHSAPTLQPPVFEVAKGSIWNDLDFLKRVLYRLTCQREQGRVFLRITDHQLILLQLNLSMQ